MCRSILVALAVTATLVSTAAPRAGQEKDKALGGWPDVFPAIEGYQRTLKAPQVDKKDKVYRQSAHYEWTGGRLEAFEVTLARDERFAKQFAPLALKDQAKETEVAKHKAWLFPKQKLVVILAPDRILQIESKTPKDFESDLPGLAAKFDLKKCAQALDKPPRTASE